jgi:hypothetical protein
MYLRRFALFLAIPLALALAGCAATVNRDAANAAGLSAPAPAARKIVLEMTGSEPMTQSADWNAFKEEWRTAMTAAASAKGASFAMGAPNPAATEPFVLVTLRVNDYRYLTQGTRFALGVMTGNAFMDLDAQFVEKPGDRVLGTRKFKTSSSAWEGIFSVMTPKQVEAVSQQIVGEVTGH